MGGTFGTIPHGSIVTFRVEDTEGASKFLSVKQLDAKADGTGSCLTLRPWADHWEHFRVRYHDHDGSSCCSAPGGPPLISLQNMRGAYLSPTSDTDPTWTFRGALLEWERLTAFEAVDGCFTVQSQAPWRPYLSLNFSDDTCSSSTSAIDTAALLRVRIVKPPVINIRPLLTAPRHEIFGPHPPAHALLRTLMETIGRAHRDVGFFHVIGHGVPMDALHIVQTSIGPLPYQHDLDWPDDRRKTNYVLADEHTVHTHDWLPQPVQHTTSTIIEGGHTTIGADPASLHQSAIRACFSATESLAEVLLHALAHAQRLQGGDGSWVDQIHHDRLLAMRALVYHPGPLSEAGSNEPFVTTAAHTDATWLTLLSTDENGGLQVKDAHTERWVDVPALPGALLVNTGNVLQGHSGGYYRAVCHRVRRISDKATRFSVPFFWDQQGSSTGGC